MFDVPELLVLVLVGAVVWWFVRQGRRLSARQAGQRERRTPGKVHRIEAEDLVACGVCGAYVASGAPGCSRPDCPRPR